jgi:hypothetical protein
MKMVVIAIVVLSAISLAGCFQPTSQGLAARAPGGLMSNRPPLNCRIASASRPRTAGKRARNRHRYHQTAVSGTRHHQRRPASRSVAGL